jgi:hypothetical protein
VPWNRQVVLGALACGREPEMATGGLSSRLVPVRPKTASEFVPERSRGRLT